MYLNASAKRNRWAIECGFNRNWLVWNPFCRNNNNNRSLSITFNNRNAITKNLIQKHEEEKKNFWNNFQSNNLWELAIHCRVASSYSTHYHQHSFRFLILITLIILKMFHERDFGHYYSLSEGSELSDASHIDSGKIQHIIDIVLWILYPFIFLALPLHAHSDLFNDTVRWCVYVIQLILLLTIAPINFKFTAWPFQWARIRIFNSWYGKTLWKILKNKQNNINNKITNSQLTGLFGC